MPRKTLKCL